MKREADSNYMQTAGRALDVLNCFMGGEPLTLTAIAKRTGLSPSVTFRLLYTLMEHGFIKQIQEGKRYFIGDRAILLGLIGMNGQKIVKLGYDLIWEWACQTGYSITITVPFDNRAVVVARINMLQDDRDMTYTGRSAPLHLGASQRILLAYMSEEARKAYVDSLFIERAAKSSLLQEMDVIRERGYDYTEGMLTKGVWALALPIFTASHEIAGGVCTSGLNGEDGREEIDELLVRLRKLQTLLQRKMDME